MTTEKRSASKWCRVVKETFQVFVCVSSAASTSPLLPLCCPFSPQFKECTNKHTHAKQKMQTWKNKVESCSVCVGVCKWTALEESFLFISPINVYVDQMCRLPSHWTGWSAVLLLYIHTVFSSFAHMREQCVVSHVWKALAHSDIADVEVLKNTCPELLPSSATAPLPSCIINGERQKQKGRRRSRRVNRPRKVWWSRKPPYAMSEKTKIPGKQIYARNIVSWWLCYTEQHARAHSSLPPP